MEVWHNILNIAMLCRMIILLPGVLSMKNDQSMVIKKLRVTGGRVSYEGLVEIYTEGQWFNLCTSEDFQMAIIAEQICNWPTFEVHMSNVFNAPRRPTTINLTDCHKDIYGQLNCTADVVSNDSNVVSLCCIDHSNARDVCSANWSTVLQREPYHLFIKPDIKDFQTYQFNDTEDRNKPLSWTKYAFIDVKHECSDVNNIDKIVINDSLIACANEYLLKTISTDEDIGKETNCYCTDKNELPTVLKLVSEQNSNTILCVAGSVTNSEPKLEAVICSKYLPPFVVNKQGGVTTPNPENGNVEKSFNVVVLVIVVIVITVLSFVVMFKCITHRNRETPVINSMNNDTYYRHEIQKGEEDEEYTLINEMEMNSVTVESRPPLPERRNDQDISTADEYSLPKDSLPTPETDSQSIYTKTYDDPIRMKLRRNTSNKSKHNSSIKSNDVSDSKLFSNTKQDLDTDHDSVADIQKDDTVKESSDVDCICSKDHSDTVP